MKKVLATAAVLTLFIGAGSVFAQPLTDVEELGKLLYNSTLLSYNETQSCASCHDPSSGFADLENYLDPDNSMVSVGADTDTVSTGGRNAPTSAYCGFSPLLHQDQAGEWVGGMFWDGRATGHTLRDPLAEQAQGPPLNPVEMNMPDVKTIITTIQYSDIADDFIKVYGADAFADVYVAYDNLGRAIAAYERSFEVTRFTSDFDKGELSPDELIGKKLFMKNCTTCHAYGRRGGDHPLFTNYKYVNVGVPVNDKLPTSEEDLNSHYSPPDLGLGLIVGDPAQNGKFKVPTLRNVAMTAPYTHNGYFPTLKEMVSFMNNRDALNRDPEVDANLSTEVGNLGLTENQVNYIVLFLYTLTDM
ncbi:MAG: c-type cytochrome [Desulfobulbaceae bacterium]|nr:c-type cytochrome [Desulfobulbaceae bacterium]